MFPEDHEAGARALVLATLAHRAAIEHAWLARPDPSARKSTALANHALHAWLESEELARDLRPREKKLLALPLGEWEPATCAEARSWLESSGTLAWALGRLPRMAAEHEPFSRQAVEAALDFLKPTLALLTGARLRPAPVLERQLSRIRLWIWRAETYQDQAAGRKPPGGYTFAELIELTAELHFMQKELPQPVQGDFGVAGRPFRELSAGAAALLLDLARARASVLAWLGDQGEPPGA